MLGKSQKIILRVLTLSAFVIIKGLGFISYHLDWEDGKFKESSLSFIYSVFVGLLFCIMYPLSVRNLIHNIDAVPTTSTAANISFFVVFLNILILVSAFMVALLHQRRIIRVYNEVNTLNVRFTLDFPNVCLNYDEYDLIFALRIYGISLLYVIILFFNAIFLTSGKMHLLWIFFYTTPQIAMLLAINQHITKVALLTFILKKINLHVTYIGKYLEKNKSRNVQKDCEFSDDIDRLAEYYKIVHDTNYELNALSSLHIFYFLSHGLLDVISQVCE